MGSSFWFSQSYPISSHSSGPVFLRQVTAAWQLYPFLDALLYWGPITHETAYPLYLQKESRLATPTIGESTVNAIASPLRMIPSAAWPLHGSRNIHHPSLHGKSLAEGLKLLRRVFAPVPLSKETRRESLIAEAIRLQLIEGDVTVLSRMSSITRDELTNTQAMQTFVNAWLSVRTLRLQLFLPMLHEKCDQLRLTDRFGE